VSTDRSCGDLVERNFHVVSNRPVALNRQVVTNRYRRSESTAAASSLVGVVLGHGVFSQSLGGRRSARTVIVGARSVTRHSRRTAADFLLTYGFPSPADDIRAVSELVVVSSVDLAVVYQQLHAADTSMLSCNVRDIDTY